MCIVCTAVQQNNNYSIVFYLKLYSYLYQALNSNNDNKRQSFICTLAANVDKTTIIFTTQDGASIQVFSVSFYVVNVFFRSSSRMQRADVLSERLLIKIMSSFVIEPWQIFSGFMDKFFRFIHKHSIKQNYDWLSIDLLRLSVDVLAVSTTSNPHSSSNRLYLPVEIDNLHKLYSK